tara:strand:+ start:978 stop:2546 length:1569 start_codon:yes stop_codon:yes gene_type:complete
MALENAVIPNSPVEVMPTQAANDPVVKISPSVQFAQAVDNGDVSTLKKQAVENFGTPEGVAANHAYGVISDGKQKLEALAMPTMNAKTPQERNIATADALKTVKDYPQWGTALISYIMGDKKTALNLVTGGQPVTQVKYGQSGKQYQYTTNQLGQVVGITDRNGAPVSPGEYEADGGGIDSIKDTYSYINNQKIGEANTASLSKGLQGANATTAITNGVAPVAKQAIDLIQSLPNLDAKKTALLTGILTQSTNVEKGRTTSKNDLEQKNKSVNTGKEEGTKLGANAGLGGAAVPEGMVGGTGIGVSGNKTTGNSLGTTANQLESANKSAGTSNTDAQNTTTNQNALARAEFLKGVPEGDQQKYIQVWDAAEQIARANQKLVDNGSRIPSFITPQSQANVVEGTPAIQIRLLKPLMNQELNAAFQEFYKNNIDTHIKNGNPPSMEEMEAAFTNTKNGPNSYKEIIDKYTKEAGNIIRKSSMNIQIKIPDEEKPQAAEKPQRKAVAPPAEKPTRKPLSAIFGVK